MNLRILKKLSKRADQYLRVIPHYGCYCESTRLVRPSYMRGYPPIVTEILPNTPCIALEEIYSYEILSAYHFLRQIMEMPKSATPKQVFAKAEALALHERIRNAIAYYCNVPKSALFGGVQ